MIQKILNFHWQDFNIFREVNDFLPSLVIDAHTHSCPANEKLEIINRQAKTPGESFNFFPLELHNSILHKLIINSLYQQVVFGFPHLAGLEKKTNNYLLELASTNENIIPVALFNNSDDIQAKDLKKFHGLKMYRAYGKQKSETKIIDIFSEKTLKLLNDLKSVAVLHLPENLTKNLEELMDLSKKYQNMNFILAHMGVNYLASSDYFDSLKIISKRNNIFMDTAMVSDVEIFSKALEVLGDKKIIFGSDAPFSFINANFCYQQNGKIALKTSEDFAWVKVLYNLTADDWPNNFFHYHIILALKEALREFKNIDKKNIFFNNAQHLFA